MLLPSVYLESFSKVNASQTPWGTLGPFNIRRYRNASHDSDEKPDTSADDGIALKNKIIGLLRDRYKKITGSTQSGDWIVVPEHKSKDWFPDDQTAGKPTQHETAAVMNETLGIGGRLGGELRGSESVHTHKGVHPQSWRLG